MKLRHTLFARSVRRRWRRVRDRFRPVLRVVYGGAGNYCYCCESSVRRFYPYGLKPRPNARCPVCLCLERHRLIMRFLREKTNLFRPPRKKMLHVAPEPAFAGLFQAHEFIDYLSADLCDPTAMVHFDLTDIPYSDDSFDVIYCSHVLEHIPDDRRAMKELYRVLKPEGWAILQVPITAKSTFEDPTVTSPEERERLFGQYDHVRRYGPDYVDRLTKAGFDVAVDSSAQELNDEQRQCWGIRADAKVYFCRAGKEKAVSTGRNDGTRLAVESSNR